MRTLRLLLICVTCLTASLEAESWRVDSARLRSVAQDSTGQVWAIGYAPSQGLYRWESDRWTPVADHLPENAQPQAIARGSDGAVYGVWSAGADAHSVTWHRGTESKILAQFNGPLAQVPNILADAQGNVWITEPGPHIYRVTPQGKAECIYTIPDDGYVAYGPTRGPRRMFNPVYATADASGRVWFWSGGVPMRSNRLSLEGLLIYDGGNFKSYPHPVGVAYEKVTALEPDDPEHMWMSLADNQLYRLDTLTLTAAAVPAPAPEAFHYVHRIYHAGGETYVVSSFSVGPSPEASGEGRWGVLWRLKNGEWKRVVNGLDMRTEFAQDPIRPFAATPAGLWVGAYGSGPWLVPNGSGEAVQIDWHYNYPLDESEGLLQLPDQRMLFVDPNRGSIAVNPADLLAARQSPPGIRTLNPLRPFLQDERGHIWGILSSDNRAFSEWNGKTWVSHALPFNTTIGPPRLSFATDSQGQIWVLDDRGPCQGPAAVLNPARANFDVYPDYPAALQAQLPSHPTLHLEAYPYTVPIFSPDGRIGYHDRCGKLNYFDGQEWHSWTLQDINGDSRSRILPASPVFFDRAGNFAVNIQGTTWEYAPKGGWRSTPPEPGQETGPDLRLPRPSLRPPPGCEFSNPESVARDRLGTYWMTYRNQFYRAIPGLCLPQISPQDHQPFIDGRTVKAALVDPQGNAFLETYFHTNPVVGEYVIVDARPPLPQTNVRASVDAAGAVKVHFGATLKGPAWFTWRIDDGAWTLPSHDAEATLNGLAAGKHRIDVAAMDERLQIDPTPAVAQVEIRVNTEQQLLALIEQLKDPDYSVRDAAVAGLVRQPALALPLLQAAREKASPDQRWWIDAAIQQIRSRPEKKPGP
jgi:hypothetical protein